MKKIMIIGSFLFFSTGMAFGQYHGGLWTYTWDMAFGAGETADFIGQTSFRGMSITGQSFVSEHIAIGGQFTWNTFYEKLDNELQEFDFIDNDDERVTGALYGTQYRYINSFPLLVTAKWFSKNPVFENFAWFGGLGAGTSIIKRRLEIGIFAVDESKWHFTLAPEAGIVFGPTESFKFFLSGQYFYSFKTSETPEHSHFNIHVGFASAF